MGLSLAARHSDPEVKQLAEGLDPGAGVPPVGDLGAQAGLHLLGLAAAAVDLAGELPLLAGQWVQAGVDDDLPPAAALPDGHDSAPGRGSIVDLSLTVAQAERHL
jgi:hypothetical protein